MKTSRSKIGYFRARKIENPAATRWHSFTDGVFASVPRLSDGIETRIPDFNLRDQQ